MYELIAGLLKDTLGDKGQAYFPYVFTLFSFILVANLIGLVPYSFTVTNAFKIKQKLKSPIDIITVEFVILKSKLPIENGITGNI